MYVRNQPYTLTDNGHLAGSLLVVLSNALIKMWLQTLSDCIVSASGCAITACRDNTMM